MKCVKKTVALI